MKFRFFLETLFIFSVSIYNIQVVSASTKPEKSIHSFIDWCERKSSLSTQTRHTVEVLLEKVDTQNCIQANQKLIKFTQLDLEESQISDIRPLSTLTNLIDIVVNYLLTPTVF